MTGGNGRKEVYEFVNKRSVPKIDVRGERSDSMTTGEAELLSG
jgi:hypothetical protein